MGKLDPRLRHVLRQRHEPTRIVEFAERVGVTAEPNEPTLVDVLVRCTDWKWIDRLREAGLDIQFRIAGAEPVCGGTIDAEQLEKLEALTGVLDVEASRRLVQDLDLSVPAVRSDALHASTPPVTGANVLVSVIDGGIDYTHDDFRNADGTSRILFLWDQADAHVAGSAVPFGREYTKADLDAALATANPLTRVPHQDPGAHGTHVAGIAAGNGRAANGRFTGNAPAADLIIVAYMSDGVSLGQSKNALAAFAYVVDKARVLARPVAINFSQGMNSGGHAGETVLETGLDDLARRPGVVIVKSAGNEQEWRIHAGGTLTTGATVTLELEVSTNDRIDDIVEIWLDGTDQVSIAVRPPGAAALAFVGHGASGSFTTSAGNKVTIDSDLDAAGTGDTRLTVIVSRGTSSFIQPGRWRLLLRGDAIQTGRYDAWIERTGRGNGGREQARFSESSTENTRTISIPGTARRVVTVGSFVTRPDPQFGSPPTGQISTFSSRGPTRYGLEKPEVAAPGEFIIAPLSSQAADDPVPGFPDYLSQPGTSMAAPHVTGVAALILSVRADLGCEEVKQVLMRTARRDGFATGAPNNTWGDGRIDAFEAVSVARTVRFPRISDVQVVGTRISWKTDIATTGAVRAGTHARQLLLGRTPHSLPDLTLATSHSVDLAALSSGTYFCEVLAFSQDNWRSGDDNAGAHYRVVVP